MLVVELLDGGHIRHSFLMLQCAKTGMPSAPINCS